MVFPFWDPIVSHLGRPFILFLGEGSPTKIDYRKKGTLILTSLLEHLVMAPKGDHLSFLGSFGHVEVFFPGFGAEAASGQGLTQLQRMDGTSNRPDLGSQF